MFQNKLTSLRRIRSASAFFLLVSSFAFSHSKGAKAQQKAFHLDRLEMWGSVEDGLGVSRPNTLPRTSLFGQIGLGYSLAPLKTSQVVPSTDRNTLARSNRAVVTHQMTVYATAGVHLFDRFIFAINLPVSPWQQGQNPDYNNSSIFGTNSTTIVNADGPSLGDLRFDMRAVIWRSQNRLSAIGAHLSLFAPTGGNNFGGDGGFSAMGLVNAETQWGPIVFAANAGVHLRPSNVINDPAHDKGLGVGHEARWAVGAYLPIQEGKYRVGANVFGQLGIQNSDVVGTTVLTRRNTPIEWNLEGRMRFGRTERMWVGAGVGTQINAGYGAPDVRVVAMLGTYLPLENSEGKLADPKDEQRAEWLKSAKEDSDKDGIPDTLDPCPFEAEDKKEPNPEDGCPLEAPRKDLDRDRDGILDSKDKCPTEAEDKDGIDDLDGCPEEDFDQDKVPDVQDACPKEPGKPNGDPHKNGCPAFIERQGGTIRILQQIHFATGSATILPDSFPILEELGGMLRANPSISLLAIEGHTDSVGAPAKNKKLSQDRTNSVKKWLVSHGIAEARLEAHGYGMEKPVADNKTAEGRSQNRRVEFKILKEDSGEASKPATEHIEL